MSGKNLEWVEINVIGNYIKTKKTTNIITAKKYAIILKYQAINVDPFFNIKYSDVDAKATGVKNVLSFQITLAMVQIRVVVDMGGKTNMSCSLI